MLILLTKLQTAYLVWLGVGVAGLVEIKANSASQLGLELGLSWAWQKQFSTHDLLWALLSSHRRSCVLMSTHKHLWVWCYGAMSAHECWLTLIASWHHAHVCSWALMSAHCSMVPSSWLLMSAANEQSWALMSPHKPSWALISSQEQLWVFLITIEHSWAAMSNHELGTMEQWALRRAQEQS